MTANHRPLEDNDIELIDRVRATPCLYDTKDPNFRLVYKKEQEWQSIADGLAMSHWEARKRWTVLRDRYARELKQLILHPDSMEYGKNDFFLRMDFIRTFVKKREVKRKRCHSRGVEIKDQAKPMPLKLYKVDCDASSYESYDNQVSQQGKSYIIDDSQYSSSGKFSYVEQMSEDPIEQVAQHENDNDMGEQYCNQDYHDYTEGASAAFEAAGEDHETLTQNDSDNYMLPPSEKVSENITIKPESTKVANNFSITTVEEEKISTLPQLQQRPIITTNVCTDSASSLQIDTEEYFSRTIALYLRQLSPRYKIKAKIEMMQIIEKFIDLEEGNS